MPLKSVISELHAPSTKTATYIRSKIKNNHTIPPTLQKVFNPRTARNSTPNSLQQPTLVSPLINQKPKRYARPHTLVHLELSHRLQNQFLIHVPKSVPHRHPRFPFHTQSPLNSKPPAHTHTHTHTHPSSSSSSSSSSYYLNPSHSPSLPLPTSTTANEGIEEKELPTEHSFPLS